jgi:hypothetical protein
MPTNPLQSDLHVNIPLTNVSIAWMQSADAYVADKVFPSVPVQKQSDLYWKYNKSEWRRTDVEKRAPSTESPGVGWSVNTDQYFAHVYAVHKDIDDQLRANADSVFQLDRDATTFITNQMLLKRDLDWVNRYFNTGIWTTDRTGVTAPVSPATLNPGEFVQWDQAGSTPIEDVTTEIVNFRQRTGYAPTGMVIGAYVLQALRNHPEILDRIKYTERGIVTEDLIASLFGVQKILVTYATSTDVNEFQNPATMEANATYSFIGGGKDALLYYAPPGPSLMTPSAGYTFTWNGYLGGNSRGIRIKNFRMEHIASDRVEAEMTYDMKLVSSDLGVFWDGAVS